MPKINTSRRLSKFKYENNFTYREMGEILEENATDLCAYVTGRIKPSAQTAERIARKIKEYENGAKHMTVEAEPIEMEKVKNVKVELLIKDDEVVASSREIASNFNKSHNNVLRDMDNIIKGIEGSSNVRTPLYFKESTYIHEQNKQEYREYLLTKKGCMLYLFNIKGYNALKLAYIEEFDRMKKELEGRHDSIVGYVKPIAITDDVSYVKSKISELLEETSLTEMSKQIGRIKNIILALHDQ